ncbi:MAG: acyl-CoA dehydrogenase family protein [Acidimicrobiales bacterium]
MAQPSSVEAARSEAAAWFEANWNLSLTLGQWWARLADSGWGYPTWPLGRYGRGLSNEAAAAVTRARVQAGALGPPRGIATSLAAPTIIAHGTSEQQDRFLPGIVHGEHIWCQLFSEPWAGSDLASLRTRAERDGDRFVVNGQKVWTSGAHKAAFGILIARTDPEQPKHRGITYFLIDMRQPGVEVRPLREMTGRAVFNEVFLTDAEVPAENVLGDLHDGWRVALTTLANERSSLGSSASGGGGRLDVGDQLLDTPVALLVERRAAAQAARAAQAPRPRGWRLAAQIAAEAGRASEPLVRAELAANAQAGETARLSELRIKALAEAARRAGRRDQASPIVSVQKMAASKNLHRLGRAAFDLAGPYGMLSGPDALGEDRAMEVIATAYMISIGGGTDQIQRNIVGERVLGLPGEPRTDKDLPFNQLPVTG